MFDTDKTPATGHDSGLHHPVDISAEEDHARALAARYGGLDAEGLLDAVINREFAGRVALVSSLPIRLTHTPTTYRAPQSTGKGSE